MGGRDHSTVIHAYNKIKREEEKFLANGGRLFYVVGEGRNVSEAREKAYSAMKMISIEGNNLHYRSDIGWRDLQR